MQKKNIKISYNGNWYLHATETRKEAEDVMKDQVAKNPESHTPRERKKLDMQISFETI